jgi:hypothetical protein
MPPNVSIGWPPGLASVLSICGVTEPGNTVGDALGTVATDIAGDLSAAGRMADQGDAVQVEGFDKLRQVVGVGVHVGQ